MKKPDTNPYEIIVIAASAGGIDALIQLTAQLPARLPVPVVIIQHLRASEKQTRLPQVLARQCILPVKLAEQGMKLANRHVYLAKPGYHLQVEDNILQLDDGEPVQFVRPAADVFFTSAVKNYGAAIIAVVLTGNGRDGTEGSRAIKAAGGCIIAQDEESSFSFRMPGSVIAAGCVDYVLPLNKIADKLVELTCI